MMIYPIPITGGVCEELIKIMREKKVQRELFKGLIDQKIERLAKESNSYNGERVLPYQVLATYSVK